MSVALLLAVFAAVIRVFRGANTQREKTLAAAILGGLLASAVHAIWDFAWFLPACMTLTILLAVSAIRLRQLQRSDAIDVTERKIGAIPVSGFAMAVAAILVAGIGVLMISHRAGPAMASGSWERFLALRRAEVESSDGVPGEALLQELTRAIKHDPDNARANVRMAAMCMRMFEDQQQASDVPLPLAQIREAVLASGFASRQEQDQWLDRVAGENRRWLDAAFYHAKRAVALCPLEGEAYTLLAELSFLEGPESVSQEALLDQALAVRPYDAHVLFAAGRDAALAGDDEQAIAYWKDAFHREAKYRTQIIHLVAPSISADEFVRHFEPSGAHLEEMYHYYRETQQLESAKTIAVRLAPQAEADASELMGSQASRLYSEAHGYYDFLDDKPRALACIERAVAHSPHDYALRRSLARQLLANNRHEEAIEQLRWCRRQKRYDESVASLWATAARGPTVEAMDRSAPQESTNQSFR